MRIGAAQSLAALVVITSACATTSFQEPTGGPEAVVQLQVPEVLAWEPEGPFDVKLDIVNYTSMILMAVEPRVEASDVTVYRADGSVVCRTPRAVEKTYEKWAVKGLQPGQHWQVKRDLKANCQSLEPGLYRYEVNYRLNYAEALRSLLTGFLGPQGGKILVKEGATYMKYEDLVAAVDNPDAVETAAAAVPAAAAPAAGAEPAATSSSPAATVQPEVAAASEPIPSASEIRACVDKELSDRGLNAYGDPKGTTYDGNPPTDEYGRVLYVASRNPGIRRACKIPKF